MEDKQDPSAPLLQHSSLDPVGLQWQDLSLSVKSQSKQILRNCYGHVRPGQLVGIMGPSGSGKTSLINLLSNRHEKTCSVEGLISLHGKQATGDMLRQASSFVNQSDSFHVNLTPRCMIDMMSAVLMFVVGMTSDQPDDVKEKRIEELASTLNIHSCLDTKVTFSDKIGTFGNKGISGGEMRRLSIAEQCLYDTPLLFLDEPTSGLDSFNAVLVMSMLKRMAR